MSESETNNDSLDELSRLAKRSLYQNRGIGEQIAYIHAKMSVITWGVLFLMFPPTVILEEVGSVLIYLASILAIFGSCLAILGIILSNRKSFNKQYQGTVLELAGLYIAIGGPLTFCVTGFYLIFKLHLPQGYPFTGLAYGMSAFMISRSLTVRKILSGKFNG